MAVFWDGFADGELIPNLKRHAVCSLHESSHQKLKRSSWLRAVQDMEDDAADREIAAARRRITTALQGAEHRSQILGSLSGRHAEGTESPP